MKNYFEHVYTIDLNDTYWQNQKLQQKLLGFVETKRQQMKIGKFKNHHKDFCITHVLKKIDIQ
jgi:hypothetical protein